MTTSPRLARFALALALLVLASILAGCGGGASSIAPATSPVGTATPGPSAGPSAAGTPRPTPIPVATGLPLGDRLVASISVASAPCALAVDSSSAWVTSNRTNVLERIDPATNAVVDRLTVDTGPCGIAIGSDGRIWIAALGAGTVVAVDPATLEITNRVEDVGPQLWDLKAGFDSIWVTDRNAKAVLRIDPATAEIQATIAVGSRPSGLAVMPEGVWVSDDIDGKVRRIDPATNAVAATTDIAGAPVWFADDGASSLLIAAQGAQAVVVLDPGSGAAGTSIGGWSQPLDGTVVGSQAWIPEGSGRRVGVVDLAGGATAEPVRYALDGAVNPFVAEPAFGDVWVLDFGGTVIWRIRP